MKKVLLLFVSLLLLQISFAQDTNTPALFPGGDAAWDHYMDTAFNKKRMAEEMTKKDFERFGKLQKVQYSFFILADGSIGIINIIGAASQPVRNEINRVLISSPRWTPATINGKPTTFRKKQVSTFQFD